ncbi:MAG: hypothetical protein AAF721_26250 [Myxococcota bacterium]
MTGSREPDALGLVHLGDLRSGHVWTRPAMPGLLRALGWTPHGDPIDRLDPPSALVVVVPPHVSVEDLERHRGWLGQARRVLLVQDLRDEDRDDPDVEELLAFERSQLVEQLDAHLQTAVMPWDGGAASTRSLSAAIQRLAAPRPVAVRDRDPSTPPVPLPPRAPGPWLAWQTDSFGGHAALVRALGCVDGQPSALDFGATPPVRVDLATGTTHRCDLPSATDAALAPLGDAVLQHLDGLPQLRPIFVDPGLGLAAAGGRCWFHWLRFTESRPWLLNAVLHQWPCGHGKKLWGHMNNEPVRIAVAPERDAYVSVYDVDAVVGSVITPRWQRAGPAWCLRWPAEDPRRILYTCPDWRYAADGPSATELDNEDCRGDAPALALGPSEDHRYALGLDREVWAIVGEEICRVGGPSPTYTVHDADHAIVRTGSGRLLCGTGQWLWIVADDWVHREDITTGARTPVVAVDRTIDAAVPLVHTANAVLVHACAAPEAPPRPANTDPAEVRRIPWFHEHFELRLV